MRTVQGEILHENAHDPFFRESRKNVIVTRAMPVHSYRMGIAGECDIVEYRKSNKGISLFGKEGLYSVFPIEYKKGKPKEHDADVLQLVAQAMCLEEMLLTQIPTGAIYYGETRSRLQVEITEDRKEEVEKVFQEMHDLMISGKTSGVTRKKSCNACSLKEICLPMLVKTEKPSEYNKRILFET